VNSDLWAIFQALMGAEYRRLVGRLAKATAQEDVFRTQGALEWVTTILDQSVLESLMPTASVPGDGEGGGGYMRVAPVREQK
jgi:hypothetical protein